MIGTFVLLVRFGCVFKGRGACIDKTRKIRQESVILHADKDTEGLVEPEPNQAKVEKNMNQELNKLVEPTQDSEKSLTSRGRGFLSSNLKG
ncbi:hypothetical protein LOAG_08831 [Loa loa]|uniref:Uncharacterized protein n=1 Tax=Loa loa TaxID=7209 RepID=A0A1S0TT56_LOALO|nr:hypothetical protein LOAG_08831 [Loa loa]EFO19655.1 hypothetical protein LOAG_08831 [Loa loa]